MFDTVVVPISHRDEFGPAIAHGATLAHQAGADLELFTVRPAYAPDADVRWHLHALADRHGVAATLEVAPPGDPAGFIADRATQPGALLCMQTHARRPIGELALGSVSEQVVRTCRHPVVLVGPHCGPAPGRYGSIVAALDGEALSEQILPLVRDWSTTLALKPWLVEILAEPMPFERGEDVDETAYVHRLARALAKQGVEANWDIAHDRHPAAAIARLAEMHQPAVIALTTHGRTPAGRLALGSVALQVAHRATVPVVVWRPNEQGG